MKNHESDPQNHETGLRYDEGCIFLFLREQLLPCGLVCLISEAPLSVHGVWVRLSAPSSPASSPPAVLRGQAGKPKPAPKAAGPGEGMLCQRSARPALVSTAPRSAPVHTSISTQGINCYLKGKRTRIRRIKIQYSLRALLPCQEASLPVGVLNI